ncbi:MAG TPA: 50S ribosomal protein L22 [Elusimicrobiota bacterium]|nr:50S ribosomal protein L22 [Elusimicrobiota bacterium]
MQAIAHSRFARYSYRKVGQVLGLIRGKAVPQAMALLPWVPRVARVLVEKTLRSAVANAGKGANPAGLRVSEAWVNHGPVLKRVRPMAMGGRAIYKRKTCHLTIVVSDENKGGKNK